MTESSRSADHRVPVIVSTDCGTDMDDQWALAHLALSPSIDLQGIVTTHAPNLAAPAAEAAARAVTEVLDILSSASRPPVIVGSSMPIRDYGASDSNPGVDFIRQQALAHAPDDRLRVVMIGPATDAALALRADPSLADRIQVIAMGFDGWPRGEDGWNVRNDVPAWQLLLETDVPLTVGDAAVCLRRLTLDPDSADALLGDGPASGYLAGLLRQWCVDYADMARQVTGVATRWPVWDEITVAHLLGLTVTQSYPRPELGEDLVFRHPNDSRAGGRFIEWIVDVDSAVLWDDLAQLLRYAHG